MYLACVRQGAPVKRNVTTDSADTLRYGDVGRPALPMQPQCCTLSGRKRRKRPRLISTSPPGATKPGAPPSAGTISASFTAFRNAANLEVSDEKTPPPSHAIRSLPLRLHTDQQTRSSARPSLK